MQDVFQSTHPVRGATSFLTLLVLRLVFQSTHPVRGATPSISNQLTSIYISIHAPRAGCDDSRRRAYTARRHFNPRTPCGVRRCWRLSQRRKAQFQSTHPVRGATSRGHLCRDVCPFQSTHPVRGATRDGRRRKVARLFQSTHPVRGATRQASHNAVDNRQFQSTHPVRGATSFVMLSIPDIKDISIHAPRAGCDGKFDDFNPLNLHKRYKRVLDRPKSTSEQGKNKAKLAYIHVFTVFLGGAKVPELSARFYFAPNTVRLSARPWRHSPLWHRNARCGCDTYPQGSKSADCLRIHP